MPFVAVLQNSYRIPFGEKQTDNILYVIDIEMFQVLITTYVKTYHDGDYLTVGHGELVVMGIFSVVFFQDMSRLYNIDFVEYFVVRLLI